MKRCALFAGLLLSLLLSGCRAAPAPVAQPESGPRDGGRLVIGIGQEPDTLDAHKTAMAVSSEIMNQIGASLVALSPEGQPVPYLAERWSASADGLVWTFFLRHGVTFHNGTPFTAQDYVYTLQRALDPAIGSPVAGALLGPLSSVEAPAEDTLVLRLREPYFPLLANLSAGGYLMPLSRAAVEARPDDYGRNPLSVGPYRFQSWQSGEAIVLERNPDFRWGPDFAHQGPPYIESIEYRILPLAATRLAALEAGDVDMTAVSSADLPRIQASQRFVIFESPQAGAAPLGTFNVSRPPFDDVRVRQAFNLAVDREGLLQAVVGGRAVPQYGPISRSVRGYWPGVEQIGYGYDVARARALLAEAGYYPGDDGILERDGQRFSISLSASSSLSKDAEVLQQQLQAIGAEVGLRTLENGTTLDALRHGDYDLMLVGVTFDDADILFLLFHSTLGSLRLGMLADPELDAILARTRSTVDAGKRQQAVVQAQKRIVSEAYVLPLYTPLNALAVSRRVHGVRLYPSGELLLADAYLASNQ